MGWTKQELIEEAFGEIGLPVAVYNINPDQMQSALRRLDAMMGTWNGAGIRLGYAMSSSPGGSNLDDESGIPDSAFETVVASLAIRIAPGRGKTISQDTRNVARNGYEVLLRLATYPPQQQFRAGLPSGAGNKPFRYRSPFLPRPTDAVVVVEGGDQIDLE